MSHPSIQLSLDPKTKAAYLCFSQAKVAKTVEAADGLYIDYDADGEMVGIEVLTAGTLKLFMREKQQLRPDQAAIIKGFMELCA